MAGRAAGRSLPPSSGPVLKAAAMRPDFTIYSHPTSVPARMLCRYSLSMATSVHYEGAAGASTPPTSLLESSGHHPLLSHHLLMKNEHHHHVHHHHRLYQPYSLHPAEVYDMPGSHSAGGYPIASTSSSAPVGAESPCSSRSSSGGADPHQLTLKSESSSVDNNMELLDSANVSPRHSFIHLKQKNEPEQHIRPFSCPTRIFSATRPLRPTTVRLSSSFIITTSTGHLHRRP